MARQRWVFVGDVGGPETFHVGDEANLEACLEIFSKLIRGLEAVVVSSDPEHTANAYGVDAVPTLGFASRDRTEYVAHADSLFAQRADGTAPAAIHALSNAEGLVICGGGNLSSSWPDHVFERVVLGRIARDRGIPVIIMGQTIGPSLRDLDRDRLGELLRGALHVGVRDAPSYALATGLGVDPSRLSYQPDDSISLLPEPPDFPWARALARQTGARWIAVTIHPVEKLAATMPLLDALASELTRVAEATRAQLVFIPHVAGVSDGTPGDAAIGRELAQRIATSEKMFVSDVLPARQMRWLTGQAELVISTRYHPIVFGLAAGVPSIALWTSQYTRVKLEGALMHAGRPSDSHEFFACVGNGVLAERAVALWSARHSIATELGVVAARWSRQAERRFASIQGSLNLSACTSAPSREAPEDQVICDHLGQALQALLRYTDTVRSRSDDALAQAARHIAEVAKGREDAVTFAETLRRSQEEAIEYAQNLRRSRDEAIEYAHSLEAELRNTQEKAFAERDAMERRFTEAQQYARSLRSELDRLQHHPPAAGLD